MSDFDDLTDKYGEVSRVITFRLNPKDGIESKALEYLASEERRGLKTREIISRALAQAADRKDELSDIKSMQQQALEILSRLQTGEVQLKETSESESSELTERFKTNLRKMARPVMRAEDD